MKTSTNKKPYDSKDVLICECHSDEHQYLICYSEDDGQPMIYVHPHLITYKNFWQRLVAATKYVFGHRTKYGHWDEFIVNPKDADKLQEIVNFLKSDLDEKV